MTIPVSVRPPSAPVPADGVFTCSLCGDCCRNLRARKGAPEWPAAYARMAALGYYGLRTEGGLQLWSWEKRRFAREAADAGMDARFEPSVLVADDKEGRLVTLVYELAHDDCPFLGPGLTEGTLVCGAYEARPLVCRAFPVVMTGGVAAPSSKCPDTFEPPDASRESFLAVFGDSFLAAEASTRVTREVGALLRFLEDAGAMRLARGLEKEQVLLRLARAPPVDLWDVLESSGVVDPLEWWRRLAGPPGAFPFTPHP